MVSFFFNGKRKGLNRFIIVLTSLNQLYELFKLFCSNTFFLDEKSIQKNHDYGSVASKLAKKAIVKELAVLRQPLLAHFFNGLLVAPSPMSVLVSVYRLNLVLIL